MATNICFGTAGIPKSSSKKDSVFAIKVVKDCSLDAMELEFVRGVRLKKEKAEKIFIEKEKHNIMLSCHAPYYINLNSKEPEKITASIKRIVDSAIALNFAGGKNVVFHCGFYQDISKDVALENVIIGMKEIRKQLDELNLNHMFLRPELTGKASQIGDEFELVKICKQVSNTLPCIDFSHYFARYLGEKEFDELFVFLNENLPEFFEDIHCHLSGIEFTQKGEKKHLNFQECEINYKKVIELLIKYKCNGTVICESPSIEEDAKILKDYYLNCLKKI
jgi:deoxyribonuclease-4